MPSGWTRWLLERFEFPFRVVLIDELDLGELREKLDVLIFVDDALLAGRGGVNETTVPHLRKFVEAGGTILTIGNATKLGKQLGLPVTNHLLGLDKEPLPRKKYYVPPSVLRLRANPRTRWPGEWITKWM